MKYTPKQLLFAGISLLGVSLYSMQQYQEQKLIEGQAELVGQLVQMNMNLNDQKISEIARDMELERQLNEVRAQFGWPPINYGIAGYECRMITDTLPFNSRK